MSWIQRLSLIGLGLLAAFLLVVIWALIKFDGQHHNQRSVLGISFSDDYARYLGLDPTETLTNLLDSMPIKHLRLMSYWNGIEATQGKYDYTELDKELNLAKRHGISVSLAIGLRQPHFPECHGPDWMSSLSADDWHKQLLNYEANLVDHVRGSVTITSWQLENEALNRTFGRCPKPDRRLLNNEYDQLKRLDPVRPIIMNVSDEVGLPVAKPYGDEVGISLYRTYFEGRWLKRYVTYPLPSWYYRVRAALIEVYSGRPVIIHELQAEPWGPDSAEKLSQNEQDKSMNAQKLTGIVEFAQLTGIREMDLWGAEWWYWRKVKTGDDSVWQAAKQVFEQNK